MTREELLTVIDAATRAGGLHADDEHTLSTVSMEYEERLRELEMRLADAERAVSKHMDAYNNVAGQLEAANAKLTRLQCKPPSERWVQKTTIDGLIRAFTKLAGSPPRFDGKEWLYGAGVVPLDQGESSILVVLDRLAPNGVK